jgi:ketosteroid isomerase-like protein
MSRENVELLRRGLEAWRRDDTKTADALLRDLLAPGFELHPLYLDKVYRGAEGMWAMRADAREIWADYRFELEDIVEAVEHVVTVGYVLGRGAEGGVPIDQPLAMLWTFHGPKAVRAKSFPSMAEHSKPRGCGSRRCRGRTWSLRTGPLMPSSGATLTRSSRCTTRIARSSRCSPLSVMSATSAWGP